MLLSRVRCPIDPARPRPGAAVVEFALLAPLLMTVFLGMIEMSRVMMIEQILNNAAREGARKGVLAGSATSDVQTAVSNYMTNSAVTLSDPTNQVSVSPDPSTASAGTSITVTINVTYSSVSWLPISLFMGNRTLSASVVMRKESNNT
jgi:Flp pilus assembly protein TadG